MLADVAEWYTRMLEVHVRETLWRFKSSRPHQACYSRNLCVQKHSFFTHKFLE